MGKAGVFVGDREVQADRRLCGRGHPSDQPTLSDRGARVCPSFPARRWARDCPALPHCPRGLFTLRRATPVGFLPRGAGGGHTVSSARERKCSSPRDVPEPPRSPERCGL